MNVSVMVEVGSTSKALQAEDICAMTSARSVLEAAGADSVVWATRNELNTSWAWAMAAALIARATRVGRSATIYSVSVTIVRVVLLLVLVLKIVFVLVLRHMSKSSYPVSLKHLRGRRRIIYCDGRGVQGTD